MTDDDPFDLARFVEAQAATWEGALRELRACRKRSHWMWFVFPQMAGLGSSPASTRYGIRSRAEARAYLDHAVLGPRLVRCAEAALRCEGASALDVFGHPDDLKLRSSATLFAALSDDDSVFHRLLQRYFAGQPDRMTLDLLDRSE